MRNECRTGCSSRHAAALTLALSLSLAAAVPASAQHAGHGSSSMSSGHMGGEASMKDGDPAMQGGHMAGHGSMHAPPVGVMGAHLAGKGKVMMMYTPMFMHMQGSRIGTRKVSPEEIVTTVPNRFDMMPANPGIQPATLRIAPDDMSMEMHMFSAMYGITDSISLMLMTSYVEKSMTMITFAGPAGATRLGTSEGHTSGMGDTTLALAFNVWKGHGAKLNATLGISIPTGSLEERGRMMMPNGMMMEMRSAYGMQLGTGTYDFVPTLTYMGSAGRIGWGAQAKARIALEGENSENYRWGDLYEATAWMSFKLNDALAATARIAGSTQGQISGQDPNIGGMFQGTYPEFYGGDRIEAFLGLNGHLMLGEGRMARIGVEAGVPLYQNLNGPQMSRDWSLAFTAGVHF